jgi:hypothetical protein
MKRLTVPLLLAGFALIASVAVAAMAQTYDRPLELTWDEAVKASRDVGYILEDSNRSEHEFRMRAPSRLNRKKGLRMDVRLSFDGAATTVHIQATNPARDEEAAKYMRKYFLALDDRLD